jgi:hypothetical protein
MKQTGIKLMDNFSEQIMAIARENLRDLEGTFAVPPFNGEGFPRQLNRMSFFDIGGDLTGIARLSPSGKTVYLSLTYLQLLWMLNYAFMSIYHAVAESDGIDQKVQQAARRSSRISHMASELRERKLSKKELASLAALCPLNGSLGRKLTGVFQAGIDFLILFEYAWRGCFHQSDRGKIADRLAMTALYEGCTEESQTTAATGIVCVIVSMFILSGSLKFDDTIPDGDDRLFMLMELIDEGHRNFLLPLVNLYLNAWAKQKGIAGFPFNADLESVKSFMQAYKSCPINPGIPS